MGEFTQEQLDQIVSERVERVKAKHSEQLSAVRAELKLAGVEIGRLRDRVTTLEPMESEVTGLRAQIEKAERVSYLSELGIPGEALGDIEAIYSSRVAGMEEAPSFRDFLADGGGGREVPLLSGYFRSADAPSTQSGSAVSPQASLPDLHRGASASAQPSEAVSVDAMQRLIGQGAWSQMSRAEQNEALKNLDAQNGTGFARRWGLVE